MDANNLKTLRRFPWTDLRIRVGLGFAVVVCMVMAATAWSSSTETTDNAQIQCDIIAIPAQVSGVVRSIRFHDNGHVKKGELLAEIDPTVYRAKLAQASAEFDSAQIAVELADAQAKLMGVNARGENAVAGSVIAENSAVRESSSKELQGVLSAVETVRVNLREARANQERFAELFRQQMVSAASYESARNHVAAEEANLAAAHARVAAMSWSSKAAAARASGANERGNIASASKDILIRQADVQRRLAAARMRSAAATRDVAASDLAYTRIYAKEMGVASNRRVSAGQMVGVGQPIVSLVTCAKRAWVVANFKETQIQRMQAGRPAVVKIDAYPGLTLSGRVNGLSGATGARFSLLPPENATGNFTKVVQRVPVRIDLLDVPKNTALVAGMSVVVDVQ